MSGGGHIPGAIEKGEGAISAFPLIICDASMKNAIQSMPAEIPGNPRSSTHCASSSESAPALNRCPSSQLASGARAWSASRLPSMPLEPEVQKGTMEALPKS